MAKDLAIVLSNGSINSAVTAALASQRYRPVLLYGDTAAPGSRQRAAYDQQVQHFKPYREHALSMQYLAMIPSAASAVAMSSDPRHSSLVSGQLLELLPLISAAARFAVHYQVAAIYLGLRIGERAEELAQATEFLQVWGELLQLPCGQKDLELLAPLLELEPWQVVDVGFQVNAPFECAWSCLGEAADPCWTCSGCRARESAFQQAGKPDPLRMPKKGGAVVSG